MIEYIVQLFQNTNIWHWLGTILATAAIASSLWLSFYYSRKRSLRWLMFIEGMLILLLFVIALLGVDNYTFYLYAVIISMIVCNYVLFSKDIARDLFRRAWIGKSYDNTISRDDLDNTVDSILRACQNLSKSDTGALILVADSIDDSILDSGTALHANVSSELLETIFHNKTPLHDGAVVISATTIVSAGCYLPLTQQLDLPREYGTRHRAAIGITDSNPEVTAIVVSEESGIISAMHDGVVRRYLDLDSLRAILQLALHLSPQNSDKIWGGK